MRVINKEEFAWNRSCAVKQQEVNAIFLRGENVESSIDFPVNVVVLF
jgi:hypothetical protein